MSIKLERQKNLQTLSTIEKFILGDWMEDIYEEDIELIEEIREKKKLRPKIGVLLSRKEVDDFMLDDFMNHN